MNEAYSITIRGLDTTARLEDLRRHMATQNLSYYIVSNEDAHGSEYVSESDKRLKFISGFTGTSGQAIISMSSAYLITESRYQSQAKEQLDSNWTLIETGGIEGMKDWVEWLVLHVKGDRVGIDARMISHEKAALLNSKLPSLDSKLLYPPRNLIDLIWKDKHASFKASILVEPYESTGMGATEKLKKLREWIQQKYPTYTESTPQPSDMQVGTLITALPSIAYILNLRGSDTPSRPFFHAYLFVGLESAVIFVDPSQVVGETLEYIKSLGVECQNYNEIWSFLRRKSWGEGKLLITPQISYAISLMLSPHRYTVAPPFVEMMMSIKNERELIGLRKAHIRDGASLVRFLAWLDIQLSEGHDISEDQAASRLTGFRRDGKHFIGLTYDPISATGPNAALPHHTPRMLTARVIERGTPYLNESGGVYRDGTCNTTRTVHFGQPSAEQYEAFTRVLQCHIATDRLVFTEGTSGHQLNDLARKVLWKDGLKYMRGSGVGPGPSLVIHEGPQNFSGHVPLVPGHIIINEPGYYIEGKWGMRIGSTLAVHRMETKGDVNGSASLRFERLTCVPIQTRMVNASMLTKSEKQWVKDHNQRCLERLAPLVEEDVWTLRWLKREAECGVRLASE